MTSKREAAGENRAAESADGIENLDSEHSDNSHSKEDIRSDLSKHKIEFLIIPNTRTAKNQLQALLKTEKKHFCLTWRGEKKLPNGKWPKSDTPYYSVPVNKKDDLSRIFEKFGIPMDEIEFREITVPPPVPNHIKTANRIAEFGDQYQDVLKEIESKEFEELESARCLLKDADISSTDYTQRVQELKSRYALEKQYLSNIANRNYRAADAIYDDGEARGELVDSFLIEPGKTHLAARRAKEILSDHDCGVFQRIGQTVRIVKYVTVPEERKSTVKRPNGAFFIIEADEPFLIQLLSERATWVRLDKRTKNNEPIDFPEKAARFLLSNHGAGLPVLTGFVCAPTLREDGSVLHIPGYDPESGLFFDPCGTVFPSIPGNPSKKDAMGALVLLLDLLKDFRFDNEVSRAVAIAEIMTGVVRRSLAYAPAFGNNAPEAGSGKSLLGDVSAIIATGNRCTCISPSNNEEENRKRLASALLGGDLVVCIDNVQDPFESESMCTILTSQHWQERLLGTNTNAQIPTNSFFIFTGNNLTFRGDMCSRVVMCNIDPQTERPGERIFDRDLRKYAVEHRGTLVVAVLTITRAYIVAGCPDQSISPFRLFSEWTKWVRSPLVWLGMADPYESTRLVTDNDPVRDEIGSLFVCWHKIPAESLSVKELLNIVNNSARRDKEDDVQALYDQLLEFAPDGKGGISPEKLGKKLRQYKGRIVKGHRLDATGKDGRGAVTWRISKV